jgi:hypothetical protein
MVGGERNKPGNIYLLIDSIRCMNPQFLIFISPSRRRVIGFYASDITADGKKRGLRNDGIAPGAVQTNRVNRVLARDEFGKAPGWVKNYVGPKGTWRLQLWVPGESVGTDATPLSAAIGYGIYR